MDFNQGLAKAVSQPMGWASLVVKEFKKIIFYHRIFEEYKKEKDKAVSLRARLVGLEEVIQRNARLERLLEIKRQLVYSSTTATVIGRNPSYWNASILIDKGSSDGVKQGQPVVNSEGVVGKIAEAGPRTSKVILLTDSQFSVAALIQRSRDNGVVSGSLDGLCRMHYLRADAQLQPGDMVITSPLSSSFPEGLLIGEVVSVGGSLNQSSLECVIRPVVSFSQLEEVLVILISNKY